MIGHGGGGSPVRRMLLTGALVAVIGLGVACTTPIDPANANKGPHKAQPADVYATYGVHNSPGDSPCQNADCRYPRAPGTPPDPQYPEYWQSDWTMYRVFQNYENAPPPYDGRPPAPLVEGRDYEVSQGASYYDSTWRGASGTGAMMEHYKDRCLPIFPIPNNYTCSFISLGNIAYFVTYPQDRPEGMPSVCLFSPMNHAPRRDFVSHLPYSAADSQRLGRRAQAYSFWVSGETGRPIQTGASPDRTEDQAILFGYAFAPPPGRPDGPLQPSSFYFSGYPLSPADAPIVSQNYTNWRATRPDPNRTWATVSGLDPATLPRCQLFDPPTSGAQRLLGATPPRHPTWGHIGRWRNRR